ncbi:MAG: DoxX family protein [Gemmatimonadaceae bacterium]
MATAYDTSSSGRGTGGLIDALGPATHALLRIGAGVLFLQHGLQKLFGLLGGFGAPGGTADLGSQFGVAGILELGGGILIILGVLVRPVAFILVLEMLSALVIAHLPRGGWPVQNGGELPLLYALIFAFLAANGAGPLSLDSPFFSSRRER